MMFQKLALFSLSDKKNITLILKILNTTNTNCGENGESM
jgi:hypothetical protein